MNDFEKKIERFYLSHTSLRVGGGKVIVALSGGADSVALLAVMMSLGFDCIAAHCNFHLRGEESDRDMEHARHIAQRLGASFKVEHFDVAKRMESTGESTEMACRELRYDWFKSLQNRYSAQATVTGHHRDDNIETMFLNLLRGSGLNGVAGMRPESQRRVSPMLEISREDIVNYLKFRNLDYITDSTNKMSDFKRNKIRNIVIPTIEQEFPGGANIIGQSLDYLAEDRDLLSEYINLLRSTYLIDNKIDLKKLKTADILHKAILFKILQPYGFTRSMTDSMIEAASGSGQRFAGSRATAVINRGILELTTTDNERDTPCFSFRIIGIEDFSPQKGDSSAAFFDASILDGNPAWEARYRQTGDRMRPLGMCGMSKKISDIFNDAHLSISAKENIPLLLRNGEILWATGIRQSDCFKVTPTTRKVAVITCSGDGEPLCYLTQ